MRAQRLLDRARAIGAAPGARRALHLAQAGLFAAVVFLLIVQLSQAGWGAVFSSLPETPWFYLIFALRYFLQPLSEIPAYGLAWRTPLWRHWTAFIRKRVYNFAVMGYSGEAFFTLWARRTLGLSDRAVLTGVKDNTLISAFVSNTVTAATIAALYAFSDFDREVSAIPGGRALFALAFLSAAGLAIAGAVFRRKLIGMAPAVMRRVIAINAARIVLALFLQAMLYAAVIPEAPLSAWTAFIALQLVVSRLPLLPNKDIVFLTAALTLVPEVGAPEAAIAGMLLAEAGLSQLFNLALFAATAHHAVRRPDRGERTPAAAERADSPSP